MVRRPAGLMADQPSSKVAWHVMEFAGCAVCATVSNLGLPVALWRRYVDLQGYYNITKIQLYNRYMRGHCGLGGACVGNGAYGAGRRCHMRPLGGLCMVFSLPRMTPDRAAQPRLPVHEPRDMSAPTVMWMVAGPTAARTA